MLLLLSSAALAAPPSLPADGLESRIAFWKKVYTTYGAGDIIIHDRFYVNLIYDVADDATVDARVGEVKRALDEIGGSLAAPDTLTGTSSRIYAAMLDQGLEPSRRLTADLKARIHTQRGVKERFRSGIVKSGRYLDAFEAVMTRYGVPAEAALLPLVESSYENVRSRVGAVGIWQFTRSTARDYLRVTRAVDERLDPIKAATAAARLLADNHRSLGSWPLAITAYNHGRNGMLRAKNAHGSELTTIIDKYESPAFGYASMNFYAEFLAAIEVYENHPTYFGTMVLDRPMGGAAERTVAVKAPAAPRSQPAAKAARPTTYSVKRGDTLTEIARRFSTSIRDLMGRNRLSSHTIYAGQILIIK